MKLSKSLLTVCTMAVCTGVISIRAQDNPAQAAARAALMEKMGALNGSQTPPPPAAAEPATPPAAPPSIETPEPATTMPAATEPAPAPAPPVVPEAMPATNAVAVQPPPKPAPTAGVKQAGSEPGFAPIVAPPLPISMTKEEQLQALNAKYMANQISPQEYFKQREAIINGP